jgi:hypothetical protein
MATVTVMVVAAAAAAVTCGGGGGGGGSHLWLRLRVRRWWSLVAVAGGGGGDHLWLRPAKQPYGRRHFSTRDIARAQPTPRQPADPTSRFFFCRPKETGR